MRIGFVVGADVVHMAPLLNRAGEIMPHVRIDVAQGLSGWVAAGVEAGRFQGGFFLGPTPPKGVHSIELTRLTYLLCIPVDWKRRVANAIPEDLAQLPWIWAPEGASYPLIVRDLFSRYGVTPRQVIEADREATIADLVASGIGVAILREPLARRSASEGRIEILDAYRAHVPLFFISPQEADQDMRTLRDCVLDVFDVEAGAD
ncbi:substrate-binding domain-containing protein [Celeribacter indicus]|nr:substrate-binding domain-containing protein [Celeribacter indicus]